MDRENNEDDLIVNYALLKIVDEYRLKLETPLTYYLVLLDTSTSMWYSDAVFAFAMGKSRFSCALQFLNDFFKLKYDTWVIFLSYLLSFSSSLNSMTDKVSLVTFDTSTLQRFGFETMDTKHLKILQNLTCEGKDTALFDSIDFCLEIFEKLKPTVDNIMPRLYLLILTDGSNNFGKKESEHAEKVAYRSGKLQILGHLIQVGNKNRKKTRRICDAIKYKFNHFNSGNVKDFADSFVNSIKPEIPVEGFRARNQASRTTETQSAVDTTALFISQLPDVPTTPIKTASKEKALA